jgi:hypothetical protein
VLSRHFLAETEENYEKPVTISGFAVEIRTGHLMNIGLELYC